MNTIDTEKLFFNGINGTTGDYLLPPSTPAQVSQMAQPEQDKDHLQVVKSHHLRDKEGHYGIARWLDPNNLAQAGWGVIFPNKHQMKEVPHHKNPDYIKVALKELLEHRKNEAGELYKEYTYYPPQTAIQFLAENGAGPGDSV
ncbi:MAG: hypothetical protein ACKPFF_18660, partial [Planktothrix sp.]